jgi:hypothetical protein
MLPQQKCGRANTFPCPSKCIPAPNDMCTMGYSDSILTCLMLDGAQLQSLDLIHSLVGVHSTDNCQLGAKWIAQFVDSALSPVCDCLGRDIEASSLVFKPLLVYMAAGAQQLKIIHGYNWLKRFNLMSVS